MENEIFKELDDTYAKEIAELFRAAFDGEPWNDDWSDTQRLYEYTKEISHGCNALNFGLIKDGRLLAISLGMVRHWWEGTNYIIEEFCVSPELQGQGTGSRFMGMIEQEIKKRGVSGIFLCTDIDKPSYRFYKKNGFGNLDKHVSLFKRIKD